MHTFDIYCVNHDVFLVDISFQEIELDLLLALLLREFETIRPEGRHGNLNCRSKCVDSLRVASVDQDIVQ